MMPVSAGGDSFPDDFHEHALFSSSIEFPVKDLFPWSEIELAGRDCDHDFTAHDGALQMGVRIVFPGAVVFIGAVRFLRRKPLEPAFIVGVQSGFIVVDKYRRGDVHCVHQAKAFSNAAFAHEVFDRGSDVDETDPSRDFKPKMFG